MSLYFAYGSNMDKEQMKKRCPSAVLLGPATLVGYRLAFTIFSPKRLCGCADIVPSSGDAVYGLLYHLTSAEMKAMDTFEGHPIHYKRILVRVDGQGGEVEAYSYEVINKRNTVPPSIHYLELLRSAAALHAFPEEYQAFLRSIKTL